MKLSLESTLLDAGTIDDSEAVGVTPIVRVKTNVWHDKKGIHYRKDILFLRRINKDAYDILKEDSDNIGAHEVFSRITNLNDCNDGLYMVLTTNRPHVVYEHEWVADYDYVLSPYTPPVKDQSQEKGK